MTANPTACLLVIGNEVLSGRTQDLNINFIAKGLGAIGIPLREVRVIPDVPETIISTVNEVRATFDHVFTTGGIGPTHDDITSECIAAAFGVPWEPHPEAWARLEAHYAKTPDGVASFNKARHAVSIAPGFTIGNVHVMAGVPRIMQAMFATLAPTLGGGVPVISRAVHTTGAAEGQIAEPLEAIQKRYPELDIGSYPYYRAHGQGVAIVAKGTSEEQAIAAIAEVTHMFESLGATPVQGEPAAA